MIWGDRGCLEVFFCLFCQYGDEAVVWPSGAKAGEGGDPCGAGNCLRVVLAFGRVFAHPLIP